MRSGIRRKSHMPYGARDRSHQGSTIFFIFQKGRLDDPMSTSRRSFLLTTGLAAFAAPLEALQSRLNAGLLVRDRLGYGPLQPVKDATTGLPLLELPEGFRYLTFGWVGDAMTNGRPTPHAHDGMAAFAGPDDTVILVRNHEVSAAPAFGDDSYDRQAGGGTTTVVFDPKAEK